MYRLPAADEKDLLTSHVHLRRPGATTRTTQALVSRILAGDAND